MAELGPELQFPGLRLVFLRPSMSLMNWFNRNWFGLFVDTAPPFSELPEKGRIKLRIILTCFGFRGMIVRGKVPSMPTL